MSCFGAIAPGTRVGAKDRQAAVLELLSKATSPMRLGELRDKLWKMASRTQIRSATNSLIEQGLVEVVNASRGGRGLYSTYRAVTAERKVAANG